MNCKQGDLAIVIRGAAVGAIVRCIERYDGPWLEFAFEPGWRLDKALPTLCGITHPYRVDAYLRPIRDNDGEDEMIRIAGRPVETPAQVIEAMRSEQ